MTLSYIFSLILFIGFAIYFILGMYILSLNTGSKLNRLYCLACLSLSIWSFCFSITNSAPDYETAILWRRLASLGYGTVYSILLHFFLILTERTAVLRNKWIYVLLYLPAVVNVFAFGYSDSAREQYRLIYTATGWVNISANGWGDVYFNLYYICFTTAGLLLLWNWARRSKDPVKKKQGYLFMLSYSLAMIAGTATDVIMNSYASVKVPQLAPVIVLLPTTAMFYAIKRYGLMGLGKKGKTEPGKILSDVNMDRFIKIMSFVYVIGGMLNFATQYFFNKQAPGFGSILLFSLFFFVTGLVLTIIKHVPVRADVKEYVFISIMLASILLIALSYIETASVTAWSAPFIVVMLSVLFNKRLMILWIGVPMLLTQIYIWVRMPEAMVQVDGSDYLARIGILGITLWLAYFVNRVYIQRLEDNEAQIRFQKLVARISGEFVKVSESDLDNKINELLELCGEHFQVDRTFYIHLTEHPKSYEWCREGVEPAVDLVPRLNGGGLPWWLNSSLQTDLVQIMDVDMLPQEAGAEHEIFSSYKLKSLISVPVRNKGKILGLLFFGSVKAATAFGQNHQELLRILANLLSDALVKVEAEREISYMAYYDALTGSANHTLFKNKLEESIRSAGETGKPIGVLFIDLDSFKNVNDTIGHLGGDEMLKEVTGRIAGCLREQDMVSRFGGDEFLIKLAGIERVEDIRAIAESIIQAIARPVTVKGQEFFITASAGIAVYPGDGESTEELIRNADLAMYAAKEKGKNQYALCSSAMKQQVLEKTLLTNSLYRALERNELVLYYQPQVSVQTKEIVGLEALVRWNNPELGMISPAAFIPLAEQTGLILPIGQWVLETACRQMKEWQALGVQGIRMAVNLSMVQFQDRSLLSIVERTLSETGLEPECLELEVTESAAADGDDYIVEVLHALKELGVSLSIDDFGSGYSSLSRLKTLPVDRIKIDMQFVRGISNGNDDEAIAKTIIQLAKNLKLHVIAEGVETGEQFAFFDKNRCDEIQGYFFYKPMPASEIESILLNMNPLPAS
ncbi:EAL domain-containing protein [Paenibacillus typhae]|uniref:Diguanylate cyclase (GGDEF) domain-containing protein n=1 Tax=Paenibacillus typhae TaxID=1174501 RepID=A0A1G8ZXZ8_9BACL|nr:EAL domain-containing protein [Paenibacillus typhae]SDK19817.1 diguanylate cyclase (GGDEF) domain-containing protein [Paenibacillus typhae]